MQLNTAKVAQRVNESDRFMRQIQHQLRHLKFVD